MIYYGKAAIAAAEKKLCRALCAEERRACYLEGFSDMPYFDTKGIETDGMGQTGQWITKGLNAALIHHEQRVMNRLPEYSAFPEYLRCELYQAEYRGDLGLSPYTCRLINEGKFELASEEFLDSDEYRSTTIGIKRRMRAVSTALLLHELTREA